MESTENTRHGEQVGIVCGMNGASATLEELRVPAVATGVPVTLPHCAMRTIYRRDKECRAERKSLAGFCSGL